MDILFGYYAYLTYSYCTNIGECIILCCVAMSALKDYRIPVARKLESQVDY